MAPLRWRYAAHGNTLKQRSMTVASIEKSGFLNRNLWSGALCVNIDVASNKEVNYGVFKSSDVRSAKKSLAA